ncbi:triphosphoribosyl-dephospho-CoA synthase [Bythopirellula polymerisocia]|uniref:ATP:dephospho-CoA triphosphoribosyl transferase n=1 Tax=Bythopirellula polymerisocia TaxID=2528003 RepID=A0A5C6BZN0_9BACT|nr:triphosphoribosyl-dephospho-CoA synthase [Bythopirellula polymerisocia]TWU17820.1 ATP:dephospho-CoA triphosphoribosyl transferase [Bythopirellula polymerisocia]
MMDLAACATLACIWEATAPKPGNVYRGADFEDVTFADFLTSAAILGKPIASASKVGVGRAVLDCIAAIQNSVGTNTYLGTVLLLGPLAAVKADISLQAGISEVLRALTPADTHCVYESIVLANPGGLGRADTADVNEGTPNITLLEAMKLGADRDMVARQYTNSFEQVFWVADRIAGAGRPLCAAIVAAFLELLADYPDSLITRKCGMEFSRLVSQRAAKVLSLGKPGDESFDEEVAEFDFWLRADGHRRNPGTSADLIAAGLFVLLRENRVEWPVRFY